MDKPGPIITSDNSHTLYNPKVKEHYHSTFGAIQESEHVFIRSGLEAVGLRQDSIQILEVGFGTGLNALLTLKWAEQHQQKINYLGVEAYPISLELARQLNYPGKLEVSKETFIELHQSEKEMQPSKYFCFEKRFGLFTEVNLLQNHFDLIYFDAFSPDAQPELWTESIFRKIAQASKPGAILTTYSCKGVVKRAMKSAGFQIEKLPGPPGKREILRATLDAVLKF